MAQTLRSALGRRRTTKRQRKRNLTYGDHVVRRDEDVRTQIRYIANNPVRRGLATEWDEYPFTGSIGHDLHGLVEGTGGLDW